MTTSAEYQAMVACAAPHCDRDHHPGADLVQLDIPHHGFLAFCNLKCLWVWASTQAEGGFHDFN